MNLQPIQQLAMIKRKRLMITLGVIFGGLWLALMAYLLVGGRMSKQTAETTPVVVRTASPTLGSAPSATNTTPRYGMKRLSYQVPAMRLQEPIGTPAAGGAAMHIHTTSSTTMKSVGGGGNGIFSTATNSAGQQKTGPSSALSYTGPIYIPMMNNAVTAVGASAAEEVVEQKMGIAARRATMTEDGEYPGGRPDPIPDEEDPVPAGDIAWSLMVILALAYAGTLYYRRRRAY